MVNFLTPSSSRLTDFAGGREYNFAVTKAAQQLIEPFEALPDAEKHEVLAQLLRRLMDRPYSSPSDEDLTRAADLVFQEYDRREENG